MAEDNSLSVVLEKCLPTEPIEVFNMRQGDILTRPWGFTVNGKITVPSYLMNGSIAPGQGANGAPEVDPRNVAVGADGQIILNPGGVVLMHIMDARLVGNPSTGTVNPLGTFRVMRRLLAMEFTLTLTEYVVNDYFLLAKVLPQLLDVQKNGGNCDSYLDFIGRINQRICV